MLIQVFVLVGIVFASFALVGWLDRRGDDDSDS
jgi:hypothetical protein